MSIHPIIVNARITGSITNAAQIAMTGDIAAQAGLLDSKQTVKAAVTTSRPKALGLKKDDDGVYVIRLSDTRRLTMPPTRLGTLVNELAFSANMPWGCKLQLSSMSAETLAEYNFKYPETAPEPAQKAK